MTLPQIWTCSSCGQQFNATLTSLPPAWTWRGRKLLCEDCSGDHGAAALAPPPLAPAHMEGAAA